MKAISTIALIALAFSAPAALACSCMPLAETFFQTIAIHNQEIESGKRSDALTIVTGTVVEHLKLRPGVESTEMVVEVSQVLQGEVQTKRLIIEGDNGMQCRPYISNFPIGKTFALAINKLAAPSPHYAISFCGQYSLETRPAP